MKNSLLFGGWFAATFITVACHDQPAVPWMAGSVDVTSYYRDRIGNRVWANGSSSEASAILTLKGDTASFVELRENYAFRGPWKVLQIVDTLGPRIYRRQIDSLRAASGDTPLKFGSPLPDTLDLLTIFSSTTKDSVIIAGDVYFDGERRESIDPNWTLGRAKNDCLYFWYPSNRHGDSVARNLRIQHEVSQCLWLQKGAD